VFKAVACLEAIAAIVAMMAQDGATSHPQIAGCAVARSISTPRRRLAQNASLPSHSKKLRRKPTQTPGNRTKRKDLRNRSKRRGMSRQARWTMMLDL